MRRDQKKQKVFKGVFISNQRKKKQGGRIKCPDLENKIQVFGFNPALHQSDVEWVEVRRYRRDKKGEKKEGEKKEPEEKKQGKGKQATKKQMKFKQKKQETIDKKEEQSLEQSKEEKVEQNQNIHSNESKNKKKIKYQLKKPEAQKQQQPETVDQPVKKQSEITLSQRKIEEEKRASQKQQEKERNDDKKEESESESEGEEQKDLQIIVAKIKKQTTILYKTKPFVAIMQFIKKKGKKSNKKQREDPIQQILDDFYVDIVPIHARLPVMQMDELIPENEQILSDFVSKTLKITEGKKKDLNTILDALENRYIFVTFSDWDGDYPLVKVHKILGKALTLDGECERFLYEHGLNDFNYSEEETEAKEPLELKPTNIHKPLERMIFTIDPPTSTDLDDALSIEKVGQNFEIGIHIADVSSYLDLIDRNQIVRRTTSVYLPYKVYHMLQKHLVKICSIDPGVFRLSFTIFVTMNLEGNVIGEVKIEKHILKSRYKLSYEVVQNIITGQTDYKEFNEKYPSTQEEFTGLQQRLLNLTQIATAHRHKRILFQVFQNKQLQFKTDQSKWPIECFVDKRFTAKKIVEEYMIIGNIQAARVLVKNYPKHALVIHHPKPNKLALASFNQQFKMLDMKFKFDNVMEVQKQMLDLEAKEDVKQQVKQVCYFRARRVMEAAIYRRYSEVMDEWKEKKQKEKEKEKQKEKKKKEKQTEDKKQQSKEQPAEEQKVEDPEYPQVHYALGLQFYTHFTSPMRRMADIVVHEVLTKIIEGKEPKELSQEEIEKINLGRRSTKRLKKDLNEVYLCLMVYHTKKNVEAEGIISSFGMESVSIYIPLFDMQRQVLWKKQFKIHSIKRIKDKQDCMDVKVYHDPKTAKKDIYWVMKKFQKVKLSLSCTKNAPLKLTIEMQVESEKGPFTILWNQS